MISKQQEKREKKLITIKRITIYGRNIMVIIFILIKRQKHCKTMMNKVYNKISRNRL